MNHPHKVFEIAFYINSFLQKKDIHPTTLQIVKLVYITFGVHGARTNCHLFEDDIQAWKYGPVIPNLYYKIKNNNTEYLQKFNQYSFNKEELQSLDEVLSIYGNLRGFDLVNKTHREGSPWANCFDEKKKNISINKKEIIEHYKKIRGIRDFMIQNNEIFISLANQ